MTPNRFEKFREERQREVMHAIGLIETMRHAMPARVFAAHITELYTELRLLRDDKVVQLDHVRLMRARELLK